MKKRFWAIVLKEFKMYVNSPIAYVVIVPFLLISNFLFFRTALVLGDANLRPFVELLPWFLVVLAPALTMRTFADEQKRQTNELLFAHPVSEWHIVLGKFLGILLFYGVILMTTAAMPLVIILFSRPDLGLLFGQYLGALLIGGTFLALGMAMSAYVSSSVGAFLLGAAVCFALILIGMDFVVLMFPGIIGRVISELAILGHLTSISRGVIDARDVLYFGSLTGVALSAAVIRLSERKVVEKPQERTKLYIILGLILAVGLVSNVLLYEYPIRLDITQAQRYTLSAGTKQLLRELPDRVNISLYTSPNLPGPMQVTLRETSDLLKDLGRYGDKLSVRSIIVAANSDTAIEARSKGIREVQFNQIGSGSFQVQTGYLGLEMRYGDKTEIIDFIDDASNLEYDLARLMLKMTRETLPQLGLAQMSSSPFTVLNETISSQYEVINLSEESEAGDWENLTGVLVLDDGSQAVSTTAANLSNHLKAGKNAAVFIDGVNVDQQSLTGSINSSELIPVLSESVGVRVNGDLVYDAQFNEAITLGSGNLRYIVAYPFWIRPQIEKEVVPWSGSADNVVMGWASSLAITSKEGYQVDALLRTSNQTNVQTESFTLNPDQLNTLKQPEEITRDVGIIAQKDSQRIVIVADTHMASDDFLQNTQENQAFVSNLIDWIAADPILLSIPKRTAGRSVFSFSDQAQLLAVQYGGMLLPPVLVAAWGFWWLRRRRQLSYRKYETK